jgi:hypothetical protein
MKAKYAIVAVIGMVAGGAVGFVSGGTLVWWIMSHREGPVASNQFTPEPTQPAGAQAAATSSSPHSASARVVVNGQPLSDHELRTLEQQYRVRITEGNYWYDRACGAWGAQGGPCAGFILAGLNLGGPLREDASNGDTGIFVNGRHLHRIDVAGLRQLGTVFQARYWLDAQGNWGVEGGPAMGNLLRAAQALGGNAGGAWMHRSTYTDSSVGGDGETFYYIDKNSSVISGP